MIWGGLSRRIGNRGFSLIEVLVSVAILSIIVIAMASIMTQQKKAGQDSGALLAREQILRSFDPYLTSYAQFQKTVEAGADNTTLQACLFPKAGVARSCISTSGFLTVYGDFNPAGLKMSDASQSGGWASYKIDGSYCSAGVAASSPQLCPIQANLVYTVFCASGDTNQVSPGCGQGFPSFVKATVNLRANPASGFLWKNSVNGPGVVFDTRTGKSVVLQPPTYDCEWSKDGSQYTNGSTWSQMANALEVGAPESLYVKLVRTAGMARGGENINVGVNGDFLNNRVVPNPGSTDGALVLKFDYTHPADPTSEDVSVTVVGASLAENNSCQVKLPTKQGVPSACAITLDGAASAPNRAVGGPGEVTRLNAQITNQYGIRLKNLSLNISKTGAGTIAPSGAADVGATGQLALTYTRGSAVEEANKNVSANYNAITCLMDVATVDNVMKTVRLTADSGCPAEDSRGAMGSVCQLSAKAYNQFDRELSGVDFSWSVSDADPSALSAKTGATAAFTLPNGWAESEVSIVATQNPVGVIPEIYSAGVASSMRKVWTDGGLSACSIVPAVISGKAAETQVLLLSATGTRWDGSSMDLSQEEFSSIESTVSPKSKGSMTLSVATSGGNAMTDPSNDVAKKKPLLKISYTHAAVAGTGNLTFNSTRSASTVSCSADVQTSAGGGGGGNGDTCTLTRIGAESNERGTKVDFAATVKDKDGVVKSQVPVKFKVDSATDPVGTVSAPSGQTNSAGVFSATFTRPSSYDPEGDVVSAVFGPGGTPSTCNCGSGDCRVKTLKQSEGPPNLMDFKILSQPECIFKADGDTKNLIKVSVSASDDDGDLIRIWLDAEATDPADSRMLQFIAPAGCTRQTSVSPRSSWSCLFTAIAKAGGKYLLKAHAEDSRGFRLDANDQLLTLPTCDTVVSENRPATLDPGNTSNEWFYVPQHSEGATGRPGGAKINHIKVSGTLPAPAQAVEGVGAQAIYSPLPGYYTSKREFKDPNDTDRVETISYVKSTGKYHSSFRSAKANSEKKLLVKRKAAGCGSVRSILYAGADAANFFTRALDPESGIGPDAIIYDGRITLDSNSKTIDPPLYIQSEPDFLWPNTNVTVSRSAISDLGIRRVYRTFEPKQSYALKLLYGQDPLPSRSFEAGNNPISNSAIDKLYHTFEIPKTSGLVDYLDSANVPKQYQTELTESNVCGFGVVVTTWDGGGGTRSNDPFKHNFIRLISTANQNKMDGTYKLYGTQYNDLFQTYPDQTQSNSNPLGIFQRWLNTAWMNPVGDAASSPARRHMYSFWSEALPKGLYGTENSAEVMAGVTDEVTVELQPYDVNVESVTLIVFYDPDMSRPVRIKIPPPAVDGNNGQCVKGSNPPKFKLGKDEWEVTTEALEQFLNLAPKAISGKSFVTCTSCGGGFVQDKVWEQGKGNLKPPAPSCAHKCVAAPQGCDSGETQEQYLKRMAKWYAGLDEQIFETTGETDRQQQNKSDRCCCDNAKVDSSIVCTQCSLGANKKASPEEIKIKPKPASINACTSTASKRDASEILAEIEAQMNAIRRKQSPIATSCKVTVDMPAPAKDVAFTVPGTSSKSAPPLCECTNAGEERDANLSAIGYIGEVGCSQNDGTAQGCKSKQSEVKFTVYSRKTCDEQVVQDGIVKPDKVVRRVELTGAGVSDSLFDSCRPDNGSGKAKALEDYTLDDIKAFKSCLLNSTDRQVSCNCCKPEGAPDPLRTVWEPGCDPVGILCVDSCKTKLTSVTLRSGVSVDSYDQEWTYDSKCDGKLASAPACCPVPKLKAWFTEKKVGSKQYYKVTAPRACPTTGGGGLASGGAMKMVQCLDLNNPYLICTQSERRDYEQKCEDYRPPQKGLNFEWILPAKETVTQKTSPANCPKSLEMLPDGYSDVDPSPGCVCPCPAGQRWDPVNWQCVFKCPPPLVESPNGGCILVPQPTPIDTEESHF